MAAPYPPTIQELNDAIVSYVELAIGQTIPLLPKSFTRVVAKALAAELAIVYKYGGFIALQMFVETASFAETVFNGRRISPLIAWGERIGAGRPTDPTRCEAEILVRVTNQSGTLPSASQLVRSSTGALYLTTYAVTLNAPTVPVRVRASLDDAGAAGTLQTGDVLTFANPLSNISPDATVGTVFIAGANAESEEAYRARVLRRWQARPQGGALADYRVWAESVPGIVRAYPYRAATPGEVDVYVEATEASSGSVDGIPTQGQLDQVAQAIEVDVGGLASRRPVGAAVNVLPITRHAFDVHVFGLSGVVDVPSTQTAIQEGLDQFLRGREPFIEGLSVLPRRDIVTAADVAGVVGSVVGAVGGSVTSVHLIDAGASTNSYALSPGEKARLGSVSYF